MSLLAGTTNTDLHTQSFDRVRFVAKAPKYDGIDALPYCVHRLSDVTSTSSCRHQYDLNHRFFPPATETPPI